MIIRSIIKVVVESSTSKIFFRAIAYLEYVFRYASHKCNERANSGVEYEFRKRLKRGRLRGRAKRYRSACGLLYECQNWILELRLRFGICWQGVPDPAA